MRRTLVGMLLWLVLAAVVWPSVHVAYVALDAGCGCGSCDHSPPGSSEPSAPHDAAHCAMCQLAATRLADASVAHAPRPCGACAAGPVVAPSSVFPESVVLLPFSQGPPLGMV